jgi:hypothetical protein
MGKVDEYRQSAASLLDLPRERIRLKQRRQGFETSCLTLLACGPKRHRGVDHLHSGIMSSGECVYDPAPNAGPPPANETVIASGVGTERIRQIAPWCSGSKDPENAVENTTVVHPRNSTRLVGQHRLDRGPFTVGEFIAHDSKPQFGSLNHRRPTKHNAPAPAPSTVAFGVKPTSNGRQSPQSDPEGLHLERWNNFAGRSLRSRGWLQL